VLVLDSIATTFLINQIEDIKLILAERTIRIKIVSIFENVGQFFSISILFHPCCPQLKMTEIDFSVIYTNKVPFKKKAPG